MSQSEWEYIQCNYCGARAYGCDPIRHAKGCEGDPRNQAKAKDDEIERLRERVKKLEAVIWQSAHILCGVREIMGADDE